MDPKSFIYSAVLLLVVAAVAVTLFRYFGLGSILGLLVTGILLGPYTPGPVLTTNVEDVRHFTELGVVFLLFLIGLEMHPHRLWAMRRNLFGLGSLQLLLTGGPLALYFRWLLPEWSTALLLGLSFALSSTAFVMQILREQGELPTRQGQTAFAILLMQDLAVVPLLALVPVLADAGPLPKGLHLWEQMGAAALMVGLVILLGRYLVPLVLDYLARQGNREAFLLTVLAAVFVAAWAMEKAGMSMALGAFLVGMLLSGSRFSLQIEASVEPHKGLLMSLFFVAVGMSVDLGALMARPLEFVLTLAAVVLIKVVVLYPLCRGFGTGAATAWRVAFLLSQGGEFGFVLFGAARALGVIDDRMFVLAVAVVSVTMLLTPLLVQLGNWLALRAEKAPDALEGQVEYQAEAGEPRPQVLIAGYGRVGHTVGTILASQGIRYLAFESDAALVARWRTEGHPVFYGDISDPHLVETAPVREADLVVLTIDNRHAAVQAATLIRARAPQAVIVARARDLVTCDVLLRAGVSRAFPEALEASLRLAAESLEVLGISTDETDGLLRGLRRSDYELVRSGPEAERASEPGHLG